MGSPITNASFFLISTLFDLIIFLFLIRFILAGVHANYFNPLTTVIDRLTKRVVKPIKRIAPSYRNFETASLLIVFILEIIKFYLLATIMYGSPNISGVVVLSVADILKNIVNIYFWAIIIQALLSWVSPGYTPLAELLAKITWPLVRPVHRLIPPIGGIDITPIPILLGLQLIIILFINPLVAYGQNLLFI